MSRSRLGRSFLAAAHPGGDALLVIAACLWGVLGLLVAFGCSPGGNDPNGVPDPNLTGNVIAPETVGGLIECESFSVPAGQTTRVTSDLVIDASGDVNIDGVLIGDASGGVAGYNITIEAGGDINVRGTIAANADAGSAKRIHEAGIAKSGNAAGVSGVARDGRSVTLKPYHDLNIEAADFLRAGDGEDGQSALNGHGQPGGKGGDIILCPRDTLAFRGSIVLGNGGAGGNSQWDPETLVNQTAFVSPSGSGSVYTSLAYGGDSGRLFVRPGSIDWPHFDAENHAIDIDGYNLDGTLVGIINGGYGGAAGQVVVEFKEDTPPTGSSTGVFTVEGARGGRGWWQGGAGGSVFFQSSLWNDPEGKHGRDVKAVGGKGGDLVWSDVRSAEEECLIPVTAKGAKGGTGGGVSATARSGKQGSLGSIHGGVGGYATAIAGDGGDAETDPAFRQIGGNGGSATAVGGAGGTGWSPDIGPAGYGGASGNADAFGGKGGDGSTAGEGGAAVAVAYMGGVGGNCCTNLPGQGGDGGKAFTRFGNGAETTQQMPSGPDGVRKTVGCD